MITNFPIIESPNMRLAKLNLIKRDKLCVNRLGYIRERIQAIISKDSIEENLNLDNNLLSQFSQQLKQIEPIVEHVQCVFPGNPRKIQNLLKKSADKLNKTFNRTKTDWQHNFIGQKYQSKIKQQMRFTKYSNIGFRAIQQKQRTVSLNKNPEEFLTDRPKIKANRGLSQAQLQKIQKKIRQKRQNRQKTHFDIRILNINKNKTHNKSMKQITQYQKLVAISPWEDQFPKIWGKI